MELNDVDIEFLMRNRAERAVGKFYDGLKLGRVLLLPLIPLAIYVACFIGTMDRSAERADTPSGVLFGMLALLAFAIVPFVVIAKRQGRDVKKLQDRFISEAKK